MRNAISAVAKLLIFILAGCPPAETPVGPAGSATAAMSAIAASPEQGLGERADVFVARAAQLEVVMTPMLIQLSKRFDGEMYKLEYRLKTRKSTLRKLNKMHSEKPSTPIGELSIDDSLRYTMKLADEPRGRYLEAVKAVVVHLEGEGYGIVKIKNYWPDGDNYSGINSVLRDPRGLEWELQFHTPRSIEAQLATRPQYEELRKVDTPIERKRELFDAMTQIWDEVPLPEGILVPEAIHEREQIRERTRP